MAAELYKIGQRRSQRTRCKGLRNGRGGGGGRGVCSGCEIVKCYRDAVRCVKEGE